MIGRDEDGAIGQRGSRAVREPGTLAGRQGGPPPSGAEPGVVRDPAQHHDDPDTLERAQLGDQVAPAAL
jgi:hypothetical protein